jgi:hypothetical protein
MTDSEELEIRIDNGIECDLAVVQIKTSVRRRVLMGESGSRSV